MFNPHIILFTRKIITLHLLFYQIMLLGFFDPFNEDTMVVLFIYLVLKIKIHLLIVASPYIEGNIQT